MKGRRQAKKKVTTVPSIRTICFLPLVIAALSAAFRSFSAALEPKYYNFLPNSTVIVVTIVVAVVVVIVIVIVVVIVIVIVVAIVVIGTYILTHMFMRWLGYGQLGCYGCVEDNQNHQR